MKMKRPVLRNFVVCDGIVDHGAGKFSCCGTFTELWCSTFPARHPRFAVMLTWALGEGQFTVTIRLLHPNRERLMLEISRAPIILQNDLQLANQILEINEAVLPAPGTYWFQISLDDVLLVEYPFGVHMRHMQ